MDKSLFCLTIYIYFTLVNMNSVIRIFILLLIIKKVAL